MTDNSSPLFRPEVLAERRTEWLGTVLLAPQVSYRLFALYAAFIGGAIAGLLFLADYTRTARVSGWLVPDRGMVRVFAPQNSVATAVYVTEGTPVRKGDRLVGLSTELQSATLGNTQAQIALSLNLRRQSLQGELEQQKQLLTQQMAAFSNRLAALRAEDQHLAEEIALETSRLRLAERTETIQRELRATGLISDLQLQQAAEATLAQKAKLMGLRRDRDSLKRQRLITQGEMDDSPLRSQGQIASTERSVSTLGQELAEVEARRETIVTAPQDGTVTAIQVEAGGRAYPTSPLLSILPSGATLEAHLYAPSRSIGFVRVGQKVLIRYQAYAYQKFGHYEGMVTSISRAAMSPGELSPELAGLTSLYKGTEPVYRVTVSLASQEVAAYGQKVALQPGMQLEADVVIERRRLIEWILDPLFTLTGRWNG